MNGLDPTVLEEALAPSRLEPPAPAQKQQVDETAIQTLLQENVLALKKASKSYQDKIEEENTESPDANDAELVEHSGGGMSHD